MSALFEDPFALEDPLNRQYRKPEHYLRGGRVSSFMADFLLTCFSVIGVPYEESVSAPAAARALGWTIVRVARDSDSGTCTRCRLYLNLN